jgi:plastocyanin
LISRKRSAAFQLTAGCLLWWLASAMAAQSAPPALADLHVQFVDLSSTQGHAPSAVVWLEATDKRSAVHSAAPGHFTLLQKNRMFSPHLLVIPAGSVVTFPNADPYFHNVFSFFNGKRFDLGLYEAGASKEVTFSREGVSYIFCNIHPEMSAVILTISTPLYGIADSSARVTLRNVPAGDYLLHIWVEGLMQPALDRMTRRVQVTPDGANSVTVDATGAPRQPAQHLNKFGQPYDRQSSHPY